MYSGLLLCVDHFDYRHSDLTRRPSDDDYAISLFADALNKTEDARFYRERGLGNPFKIFNDETGFMEARDANGSFAGPDAGWTEGDKWIYTFDVVQNIPELALRRGGNTSFVQFLDEHFDGGRSFSARPR